MKYLLDTNIITAIYDSTHEFHNAVKNRLENTNEEDEIFVSILSIYEFEYSLENCTDDELKEKIQTTIIEFKKDFDIINLSPDEGKIFGKIKSKIRKKHKISKSNMRKLNIDIMIASTAIFNKAIFVSNDVNFLKKIRPITDYEKFESWIGE